MNQDAEINIGSHLEDLRKNLIVSLVSVAVTTVVSLFFSDLLLNIISSPIQHNIRTLYFLSPYEAFMTKLKIALVSGIVLSSPIIFTQLWLFISPGLYPKEQKIVLPLVLISTFLFIGGVTFSYFLVIPFALNFFLNFQTPTLQPLISIDSYISFFLSLVLIFGVIFDTPVLLVGLISLGVLGTSFLAQQRRAVIVLVFILAAVLTPTVDVFTQCLLAIPLWMLFEISILIGRRIEKRRTLIKVS